MTFEERVAKAVEEKLSDGTVEKLVREYVEKAVKESLDDSFGWKGKGKKLIQEKLDSVLIPAIESHDFNRYIVKLDEVLTDIINDTRLAENRKILKNFQRLMKEPNRKEIKLSEIFDEYRRYVAENVCTDGLKVTTNDGAPRYENVHVAMAAREREGYFRHDKLDIDFTCEEDDDLNVTVSVWQGYCDNKWYIATPGMDDVNFRTLSCVNEFWMFLATLRRAYTGITIDDRQLSADIEPTAEPQPEYR